MERLKKLLAVTYRVYFITRDEVDKWLTVRGYKRVDEPDWDTPEEEEWFKKVQKKRLSTQSLNNSI